MITDKRYCMSSFLMFRTISDHNHSFQDGITPVFFEENPDRTPVENSFELKAILREQVEKACADGKAALALSGGIDSAILAKFMPRGSVAYTFKCVVPGIQVVDESPMAAKYAKECGLVHKIIEITWEDMENLSPVLMKHKGAPIHSIEVQIYKAALQAKDDGFNTLIFGESADLNYGGLDGLLSRDWTVPQFIERYSYVLPYRVLKSSEIIVEPFEKYSNDGFIDIHEFMRHPFYKEAMGSYTNATQTAGIDLCTPYAKSFMAVPLDYQRIRSGDSKYFIREIFRSLYPNYEIPKKTPMPRPMNEWLKDWKGPERQEFWPHCVDGLTGDQKWLVWALEKFLNITG